MSESVENEWLCSKIVAAFGLPVAHCDLATFEDQKVLIVKRFDRKYAANKSWIIRLPQEDFCQAKSISPLHKYQKHGGPGIADCIKVLDGASEPAVDRQTFFKAQIIFWLLFATEPIAQKIYDMFPDSFPQYLAEKVLQGMRSQARKLRE